MGADHEAKVAQHEVETPAAQPVGVPRVRNLEYDRDIVHTDVAADLVLTDSFQRVDEVLIREGGQVHCKFERRLGTLALAAGTSARTTLLLLLLRGTPIPTTYRRRGKAG